jgi:hypothetical protein
MNNAVLTHYINAKKEEQNQRKEEARKKVEEDQSSKGLFPPDS